MWHWGQELSWVMELCSAACAAQPKEYGGVFVLCPSPHLNIYFELFFPALKGAS